MRKPIPTLVALLLLASTALADTFRVQYSIWRLENKDSFAVCLEDDWFL
jgi:hypothetical protein